MLAAQAAFFFSLSWLRFITCRIFCLCWERVILSSSLTPYTETLVAWLNSSRLVFLFNSESELSKCYIAINEKKNKKNQKQNNNKNSPLCCFWVGIWQLNFPVRSVSVLCVWRCLCWLVLEYHVWPKAWGLFVIMSQLRQSRGGWDWVMGDRGFQIPEFEDNVCSAESPKCAFS